MFETTIRDGVLRVTRSGAHWLSTGWNGGEYVADAAYNVSVPEGWECDDVESYADRRLADAEFDTPGPVLLTGVDMNHARGARLGPVAVVATAGISNPAALPMAPSATAAARSESERPAGTVNVIVGTTRALADGALANLVAVAAEAKAATLLAETGFPGTTTDAVVVGSVPDGERAEFSGSATPVGAAARACVRDAVKASLRARYEDAKLPESVADAEFGVVTDEQATVFEP